MRCVTALFTLCAAVLSGTASAETTGLYRADEGPELAAELLLRPDGTYAYALSVGALDETSQGTWREDEGVIRFETEPRPVPPEFLLKDDAATGGAFLLVTWPNGRGVAGVDFRIGFDQGDPIETYTQADGWDWPENETRTPRWIEFAEPIHRLASPRYPLAPGVRAVRVELVPNDLGVVDFTQATAQREGDRLLLRRTDGLLKFVKAKRQAG